MVHNFLVWMVWAHSKYKSKLHGVWDSIGELISSNVIDHWVLEKSETGLLGPGFRSPCPVNTHGTLLPHRNTQPISEGMPVTMEKYFSVKCPFPSVPTDYQSIFTDYKLCKMLEKLVQSWFCANFLPDTACKKLYLSFLRTHYCQSRPRYKISACLHSDSGVFSRCRP